jgi:hypothetical protein
MSPKGDAGLNGAVNCEIVYFRGKNKGRKNKGASLRASQKILGTTLRNGPSCLDLLPADSPGPDHRGSCWGNHRHKISDMELDV